MDNGITDELREYVDEFDRMAVMKSKHGMSFVAVRLSAIADNIDAAYEEAMSEQLKPLAHMESMTDKSAVDDYRVLLPVDADGVPIHVGDTLLGCNNDTSVVKGLTLSKSGWELICDNGIWHDPDVFIHYHKPTVEDILQEFGDEAYMGCDTKETIIEFANRIREAVHDEQ